MQQVTTNSNHSIQIPGSKEIASIRVVQSYGCGYPKLYARYKGQTQYVPLKIGEAPSSPGLNGRYVDVFSDQTVNGVKSFAGYIRVSSSYIKGGATQIFGNTAGGGLFNVLIGTGAGNALTGQKNIMIGDNACVAARAINNTVAIGVQAGPATNYLGDNNFFLGYKAGYKMTGGSGNVHIGQGSGISGTYSNRLFIGNPGEPTTLESAHVITGYFDTGVLRFPKGYANTDASKFLTTGSDGTLVLSAPKMPTDYISNNPVNTLPRDNTSNHGITDANLIQQSLTYWNSGITNIPSGFSQGQGLTGYSPDHTYGVQILADAGNDAGLAFRTMKGNAWNTWHIVENQDNKVDSLISTDLISTNYPSGKAINEWGFIFRGAFVGSAINLDSTYLSGYYRIQGTPSGTLPSGYIVSGAGTLIVTNQGIANNNYEYQVLTQTNGNSWWRHADYQGNWSVWLQYADRDWVTSQISSSIPTLQQVTAAGNTTNVNGTNGASVSLTANSLTFTPVTNANSWARGIFYKNNSGTDIGEFGAFGNGGALSYLYLNSANSTGYANPDVKIFGGKMGINLPSGAVNLPIANLDVRGNAAILGPDASTATILSVNTSMPNTGLAISNSVSTAGIFAPKMSILSNNNSIGITFNTHNTTTGFGTGGYVYDITAADGTSPATTGVHTNWRNAGTLLMALNANGNVRISSLSGSTVQMVTADTGGTLGVSAMPVMTEVDPVYTADKPSIYRTVGALSTGDDLDNYKSIGVWTANNTVALSLLNLPSGYISGPVTLFVRGSTNSTYHVQVLNTQNSGTNSASQVWRRQHDSSGVWSPWKKIMVDGDNISLFTNDAGYITSAAIPAPQTLSLNNFSLSISGGNTITLPFTPYLITAQTNLNGISATNTALSISSAATNSPVPGVGGFGFSSWGGATGVQLALMNNNGAYVRTNSSLTSYTAWVKLATLNDIPIVNDATLTLQTSGIATGGTVAFTANSATAKTFTVNVPATNITASLNATTHVLSINSSTGTDATVDLTPLADGQLLSSGGGWQLKNQATGKQAVGTNALDFIIYDSAYTGNIGVTGEASVAFGKGNFVSGDRSASFGSENTSTGSRSFSLGLGSDAVGDGSFAHGQGTTVNGAWAAGFGISHVDGNYAFAAGNGNYAPSYSEISVGIWSTNYTPASATAFNANDRIFNIGNGTSSAARKDALTVYKSGIVKVSALAGSGSRMVTADADGNLSTQAITAGTVTSVGMTVGGAALNVTPATIASAGTFALTWAGTSAQYVNGQGNLVTFPAIPAGTVKSITIGNGLTGTSPITSTGTITLGTPGSITLSSANSVTAGSHTHTLDLGGTSAQYLRGDGTLATFPTIPTTPSLQAVTTAGNNTSNSIVINFGTAAIATPLLQLLQNNGSLVFENSTSASGNFLPVIQGTLSGTNTASPLSFIGKGADSYTRGIYFSTRNTAGTGVVTGGNLLSIANYTTDYLNLDYLGNLTLSKLSGNGVQSVVADANGTLSAVSDRFTLQRLPGNGVALPHTMTSSNAPSQRTLMEAPQDVYGGLSLHFKNTSTLPGATGSTYASLLHINTYNDSTGISNAGQLAFTTTGVWHRPASSATAWNGNFQRLAYTTDILSYTAGSGLTLTGTAFSLPVTVSGSGNYVSNVAQNANGITVTKATLPTIGNGTLTIQQNGSTVGTFTANQGNNTTINLTGGGNEVVGNGYGYGRSNNFGSGWDAAGGFAANSIYITTNTPYQVSENDYTVYLFASGASVILPDPTDYPNRMIRLVNATKVEIQAPQQYAIKNYDGNSLVNMGTGSYLIQSIRGAGGLWLWYLVGGNS